MARASSGHGSSLDGVRSPLPVGDLWFWISCFTVRGRQTHLRPA